jgi:hypothetical protein
MAHEHGSGDSGSFTFLVTSLLSGSVIAEVELSSMNFTEVLNRPGNGSATARIESDTTTEQNFLSWANALWCLEGDHVLWGGIVGDIQPRAGSRVLNIPLYGFMEYYRTQPIQTTVGGPSGPIAPAPNSQWDYGFSYGGHPHKSVVIFDDVDQFRIFEDLINHVAKRDPLSNIHPTVSYDALSGVLRDDHWFNYEYKMVGIACEQLADRENGFFWHTHFGLDDNSPTFNFHLHLPTAGVNKSSAIDRPIIFEWDAGPEETVLTEYDFGGEGKPANSIIAIGEGEGSASLVARKDSTTSPTGEFTGGRPRYYEVISYTDVSVLSTLQNHATKRWNRHKVPFKTANITMQNPDDEYLEFDLGDTANLRIDDHGIQTFNRYRIVTKSTTISKEGDKIIGLDMEEPFVFIEGDSQ